MENSNAAAVARIRERLDQANSTSRTPPGSAIKCELCQDSGFIRVELGVIGCDCQKQKARTQKLAVIPKRFQDATFASYVPGDARQRSALSKVSSEITKNFFIHGQYARGKTHLAISQYRKLIEIERPCALFSMAELLQELRRAEVDSDYFSQVRHRVRHADPFHLFIDDIDKFKVSDFKAAALFDLIDTIYKRNLGLTITSNYSIQDLGESGRVDWSVLRRIDDICEVVEL